MKTIHERAHDAVGHPIHKGGMQTPDKLSFEEQVFINGHIKGATDQKEIDIDKACDVYRKELEEIIGIFNRIGKDLYGIEELGELIHLEGSVKDFRKAMEE